MQIHADYPLKALNTFSINAHAKYFSAFKNDAELRQILSDAPPHNSLLIIGGGSNVLFTTDFDGLVLKNDIRGIEQINEDEDAIFLKAGAGENWHRFVQYAIAQNLGGVENLSLIPGCVGASPIQNIGAYGVELKDTFFELEAYDLAEKTHLNFSNKDCDFGYRDSIFKRAYKNRLAILSVTFRLLKSPVLNTKYGAIEEELAKMQVSSPTIKDVSRAVINIRQSKLPDPAVIGNAGSFFKNPEIMQNQFDDLKREYANLPGYPVANNSVKLPAAWLIEQCGWKGFRRGDAGCHNRQPLVLVNYGNASGRQIYDLSTEILNSVRDRFGITLEREVNIL